MIPHVRLCRGGGGSIAYALTYASSQATGAGVLIETLAFGKHEVPRLGPALPFDSAPAKRRFDRGDDDLKEQPCEAPVTDRS